MKTELTTAYVRGLPSANAGKNYMVYDSVERGFAVRVTATGSKTFVLCYSAHGRERRYPFATFPGLPVKEARKRAGALRSQVKGGADPAGEKVAAKERREAEAEQSAREVDFARIADRYIAEHAKIKKRTWREDERRLHQAIVPAWGKRKVKEITRADVDALVTPVAIGDAARGIAPKPAEANARLALVRKVFSFAVDKGVIDHHPCLRMSKPGGAIEARERALTEARELKVFWRITSGEGVWTRYIPKPEADALRFALLTGCRASEAAELPWSEIDLDKRTWTLAKERSKNKRVLVLPLTDTLYGLLKARHDPQATYVFPALRAQFLGPGHLSRALRFACQRLVRIGIAPFTPHDLRRSAETNMDEAGVGREYRDRVLNHINQSVGEDYNKSKQIKHKLDALEALESYYRDMIEGPTSNVVQFRKVG